MESSCLSILEKLGIIADIVIAILTLFLAYYVFVYQKKKDKKSDKEAEKNRRKKVKLQWFKELIIQPKIELVFSFYDKISQIKQHIKKDDLEIEEKIIIINFLKNEQAILRKSFLDLILHISKDLYNELSKNLDELTDELTVVISNDENKLTNETTYNREIKSRIEDSYNKFLSKIFNFQG